MEQKQQTTTNTNELAWTTDPPTEPGWYWAACEDDEGGAPYLEDAPFMILLKGRAPFFQCETAYRNGKCVTDQVNLIWLRYWAGPINLKPPAWAPADLGTGEPR